MKFRLDCYLMFAYLCTLFSIGRLALRLAPKLFFQPKPQQFYQQRLFSRRVSQQFSIPQRFFQLQQSFPLQLFSTQALR